MMLKNVICMDNGQWNMGEINFSRSLKPKVEIATSSFKGLEALLFNLLCEESEFKPCYECWCCCGCQQFLR